MSNTSNKWGKHGREVSKTPSAGTAIVKTAGAEIVSAVGEKSRAYYEGGHAYGGGYSGNSYGAAFESKEFGKDGTLLVVPELGKEPVDMIPHVFETKAEINFPTVFLSPQALEDIRVIIEDCSIEISFMGMVDKVAKGFYITEVFVPGQECHGGRTRISVDNMFALAKEMGARKLDMDKLRFWGHSHVNMTPNPSGDDERQAREFGQNSDWFITAIGNKHGIIKFTVHHYDFGLTLSDVPWTVLHRRPDVKRREEIDIIMRSKVKELKENFGVGAGFGTGYKKGAGNIWVRDLDDRDRDMPPMDDNWRD